MRNSKVKITDRIELSKCAVAGAELEKWKNSTIDTVIAASAGTSYTRPSFQQCFRPGAPQDEMYNCGANEHLVGVFLLALDRNCVPKSSSHPARAKIPLMRQQANQAIDVNPQLTG